jgi:uncharacterized membrane protein
MGNSRILLLYVQLVLYGIFIISGLGHLICALNGSCLQIEHLIPPWAFSVYALFFAHIAHAAVSFGLKYTLFFFSLSFLVICLLEESSLRYDGLIFGRYSFTQNMGTRITPHLPLLVPICWVSLIYPTFLLTNLIHNGYPTSMPPREDVLKCAMKGALLLTAFDLVSEPIHVKYGHLLWQHAAFVDPLTPLLTYSSTNDWHFDAGQPFDQYFGIPLQVNTASRTAHF